MNINELFKQEHGAIEGTSLIPITFETEAFKPIQKDIDKLKEKVPELIDHIYFKPSQIINFFCYYKDNVYVDINSLEWQYWEMFDVKKMIEYQTLYINEYSNEKDYDSMFSFMEKKILIPRYIKEFNNIPVEQKYTCFRDVWRRSEYGFNSFTDELLEQVFSYREYSEDHKNDMKLFFENYGEKDCYTIYRGVASKSTHVRQALSWTMKKDIAEFFATRFSSNGVVYKAIIYKSNILDFLSGKKEEEIFVNKKGLLNIEVEKLC